MKLPDPALHAVRRAREVMGTWASIHVHDDAPSGVVDAAIASVFDELDRLEDMFSTFREWSEISRLNRGDLRIGEVSPEVVEVLDHCTWLEHASKGAFDIRPYGLEGPIDPSGFVKGWATERAAGRLRSAGLHNWYVSVGGDIVVSGRPSPDRRWSVGIVDPFDDTQIRATFEVEHGAVATSGTSARGQHIWDPRTHQPAASYASMTVVGPSLAWADAFATTAFVMGAEGLDWVHRFAGYVAWAVRPDGTTDTLDADDERLQRASAHRR